MCPERCPYTGHLESEVMAYVRRCLVALAPPEGVTVVSLDDPAVVHDAIALAIGEPPLRKRRGRKAPAAKP
jgi:hypothetical protein